MDPEPQTARIWLKRKHLFNGIFHSLNDRFDIKHLSSISRWLYWLSKTSLLLKFHQDGDEWRTVEGWDIMMMKSKNKKKRLVHFVKKMVVDFLTAQTRGHFYEMNQAPTFMNDFRCNHAWLSRIATNNKWNTSISEAPKPKDFGPSLYSCTVQISTGSGQWAAQERSLISSTSSNPMNTPNSSNESPSLVL
jgi:hypothetical protein